MNPPADKPIWALPYDTPLPAGGKPRRAQVALRVAAYTLLAVALIVPVIQFQRETLAAMARQQQFLEEHPGETPPVDARFHWGAIGRFRKAIHQYWQGRNIYRGMYEHASDSSGDTAHLHPNTPFTVILLSAFAYLPIPVMAVVFNLAKLAVLAAVMWMASAFTCHGDQRIKDWVLGLAWLWGVLLVIGDIQHGNTNILVLGAIVWHLWLYRRGRDVAGGAALAIAVCLKMTPALFLLYWAYQRSWRMLASAVIWLAVMMFVVPAFASFAIADGNLSAANQHYTATMGAWLNNLIKPGLVKGAWYPIHANQSLSGVASRYLLAGDNGKVFWNPDDNPNPDTAPPGWINVADLPEQTVKSILRGVQLVIVLLMGWAIGWRKLPRDDGRRALHYSLVLLGMMLLNQRTWDHHAAVLLPAYLAVWQAIAFGTVRSAVRKWAMALTILSGLPIWLGGNDLFKVAARLGGYSSDTGNLWADYFKAYGPTCLHFLLIFAAAVLLTSSLRRCDPPYATRRMKLSEM